MMRYIALIVLSLCTFAATKPKVTCATCPVSGIDRKGTVPFAHADNSRGCSVTMRKGFPVPDPKCTPGAVNPTVTLAVLRNPSFATGCIRNCITSETVKEATYRFYKIPRPAVNKGPDEICELDHLVSLELGGADSLDNIWPQCGPEGVSLAQRYLKIKDGVENYLAAQVRSGAMDLGQAQAGIAKDWTQYLGAATGFCAKNPATCAPPK